MKISNGSYLDQLDQAATNHLVIRKTLPRIAILGIGNELNGDDGAGLLAVRCLSHYITPEMPILIREGSISPENYTSPIRKFKPDWIWFFDAAEMGSPAGDMCLLDPGLFTGLSASTHSMPLSLLVDFLAQETGAEVYFFGIQPESILPFTEISSQVSQSVLDSCQQLGYWIRKYYNHH